MKKKFDMKCPDCKYLGEHLLGDPQEKVYCPNCLEQDFRQVELKRLPPKFNIGAGSKPAEPSCGERASEEDKCNLPAKLETPFGDYVHVTDTKLPCGHYLAHYHRIPSLGSPECN